MHSDPKEQGLSQLLLPFSYCLLYTDVVMHEEANLENHQAVIVPQVYHAQDNTQPTFYPSTTATPRDNSTFKVPLEGIKRIVKSFPITLDSRKRQKILTGYYLIKLIVFLKKFFIL